MVSNRVRSVKICPGTTFCKRAKQDSVHLGMQLERKYLSQEMPSKMKIGVSGCINSCTESRMKDVGVIGSVEGWSVYAGGSGGAHPRIGDLIAEVTTEKKPLHLWTASSNITKQMHKSDEWVNSSTASAQMLSKKLYQATLKGLLQKRKQRNLLLTCQVTAMIQRLRRHALNQVNQLHRIQSSATSQTSIQIQYLYYKGIGMGCLGCPSSTMEPLWQAAEIHGVNVYDLLNKLETARKGA